MKSTNQKRVIIKSNSEAVPVDLSIEQVEAIRLDKEGILNKKQLEYFIQIQHENNPIALTSKQVEAIKSDKKVTLTKEQVEDLSKIELEEAPFQTIPEEFGKPS